MNSKTSDLKIEILNYISQNRLIVNNDINDKLAPNTMSFYQTLCKIKNDLIKLNSDSIYRLLLNNIEQLEELTIQQNIDLERLKLTIYNQNNEVINWTNKIKNDNNLIIRLNDDTNNLNITNKEINDLNVILKIKNNELKIEIMKMKK